MECKARAVTAVLIGRLLCSNQQQEVFIDLATEWDLIKDRQIGVGTVKYFRKAGSQRNREHEKCTTGNHQIVNSYVCRIHTESGGGTSLTNAPPHYAVLRFLHKPRSNLIAKARDSDQLPMASEGISHIPPAQPRRRPHQDRCEATFAIYLT